MAHPTLFCRPDFNASRPSSRDNPIKTVAHLIEFNAQTNADYVFCVQAESCDEDTSPTFLPVTHSDLKRAVVSCQSWITQNVAKGALNFQDPRDVEVLKSDPVALMMESDLSILIHLFALFGIGVPVLLLSTRLSPMAVQHLLAETNAAAIIASPRLHGLAREAISIWTSTHPKPMLHIRQSYKHFLNDIANQPSNAKAHHETHYIGDRDRQVLILHSSGTTSLPKAISQSHRYILNYGACHDFPDVSSAQGMNVSTLPLFHGFGLLAPLLSLSIGKRFTIPCPNTIPSGSGITSLLKMVNAKSLMTVPSIIEEISDLPSSEGIENLAMLDFVACGGGTLKSTIGSTLAAAGVQIVNSYGCTEAGPLSVMYKPETGHDWKYFRLREDMDIQILEDLHPSETAVKVPIRLRVLPPGWEEVFEVPDIFCATESHPTVGKYLRPLERIDDVLVLKTGEKVSPHVLETLLSEREDVRGALAFGNDQFQLGVLIEPTERFIGVPIHDFKMRVWNTIVEAGRLMETHARVSAPEAIIILTRDATLPRSDKGAILRRDAYQKFETEIQKVYKELERTGIDDIGNILKGDIRQNLTRILCTHIWRTEQPYLEDDQENLFELGMDSLQSLHLQRMIFSSVAKSRGFVFAKRLISKHFVYLHPSISSMAKHLAESPNHPDDEKPRDWSIRQFVESYSIPTPTIGLHGDFNQLPIDACIELFPTANVVVLLTGSSGGLGSHLLLELVSQRCVSRVICLNRPNSSLQDPFTRQLQCSERKGATIPCHALRKIEVLETKITKPYLGLDRSVYRRIASSITHVVHAAWPMDFNRKLPSFEPQFQGLRNLVALAHDAKTAHQCSEPSIRLLFISSISVIGNHPRNTNESQPVIVPEEPMESSEHTLCLGYAEAKLVCENIVRRSHDLKQLQGTIVRMGQIAGSKRNGYWNTAEHFPVLVKSSTEVGKLPNLAGSFSWLPLEDAASSIKDLLLSSQIPHRMVYHVENPTRQQWNTILSAISERLSLPMIPYKEWLIQLRSRCQSNSHYDDVITSTAGSHSTLALLDFFETEFERMSSGSIIMDKKHAQTASSSMRKCSAISSDLVRTYLDMWMANGFLSKQSSTPSTM